MPLPITMYGASHCEDTQRVRERLIRLGVPFKEVDVEQESQAAQFVIFVNAGFCSTPTLVFGEGKFKVVLTEPSDEELNQTLLQAGYELKNI